MDADGDGSSTPGTLARSEHGIGSTMEHGNEGACDMFGQGHRWQYLVNLCIPV